MKIIIVLITALVPMIMGFIWYNPKVFGGIWMKETGLTMEDMKGANMAKIFGLSYLFAFFVAFAMYFIVIHQSHLPSIVMGDPDLNDPNSQLSIWMKTFMEKYGHNFRTFKHGALHGTIAGIMLALPVIGTNALYERRSGKYILVTAGFWIICFALMGGVICQWG